jgi:AcrR family transcriptional regulator
VFADLDALILAVKERTLDRLDAGITEHISSTETVSAGTSARDRAEARLQALAALYLGFASAHPKLWQAVFEHRSPDPSVPASYVAKLDGILKHVEGPFDILVPDLAPPARQIWARAVFSAVHGVVALGLDEKLGPLTTDSLRWQVQAVVHAVAAASGPPACSSGPDEIG